MCTGQFTIYRHTVIAGNRSVHHAFYGSFHPTGIGFCSQIHLDLVAAAEGDVFPIFILALLHQFGFFIYGNFICRSDKRIAVRIDIFGYAAAFSFYLIINIQIGISFVNLPLACSNFGCRIGRSVIRSGLPNVHVGSGFDFLSGFNVRRYLDHAAHVHVVVPGFPVIGPSLNPVSRRYIALACSQLGTFLQFRPGIHLHIVIGVGPGHTKNSACAGLGASFGSNLLNGTNIRTVRHIPCAGQRCRIGRLRFHSNGSRRAPGCNSAGVTVRKALCCVISGCTDFQIFQFGSPFTVCSAFSRNQTLVVAFCLGIAGTDGCQQAYGSISDNGPAAGIIPGNESQIGIGSLYGLIIFLPLFIFHLFGLFRFIGYIPHVDAGRSFRNGLRLIGIDADKGSAGSVGFGMGHIRPFLANDGLRQHRIAQQLIPVCHIDLCCRICLRVTLHYGNADQGHAGPAGFRLNHRGIDRFHFDGIRSKGITAVRHGNSR